MTRTITNSTSLIFNVFCINLLDGKFTAQLDQTLVGTSAEDLRFGQDRYGNRLLSALRQAPEGKIISVAYNALRPGTKSGAVPKVSFVARVGNQGCGVGYYRQKLQPSQLDELPPSREAIRLLSATGPNAGELSKSPFRQVRIVDNSQH